MQVVERRLERAAEVVEPRLKQAAEEPRSRPAKARIQETETRTLNGTGPVPVCNKPIKVITCVVISA